MCFSSTDNLHPDKLPKSAGSPLIVSQSVKMMDSDSRALHQRPVPRHSLRCISNMGNHASSPKDADVVKLREWAISVLVINNLEKACVQ